MSASHTTITVSPITTGLVLVSANGAALGTVKDGNGFIARVDRVLLHHFIQREGFSVVNGTLTAAGQDYSA